jgi:hypothetical protein
MPNYIFYGPSGVGKYSQALYTIAQYSPSRLKYEKKMTLTKEKDKTSYIYRLSDVHYEVDMSLLGCNSKTFWEMFYSQVVDIVSVKPEKTGIILCKNFHHIHSELLEMFFSFVSCYPALDSVIFNKNGICIKYIFITEHLSFIPASILQQCRVVAVERPQKGLAVQGRPAKIGEIMQVVDMENIVNLKEVWGFQHLHDDREIPVDIFNRVCQSIIQEVESSVGGPINYFRLREVLYDISIYQLDIMECLWFIMWSLGLKNDVLGEFLKEVALFVRLNNNNYRTIYHYERIFVFLILLLQKCRAA